MGIVAVVGGVSVPPHATTRRINARCALIASHHDSIEDHTVLMSAVRTYWHRIPST